MKKILLYALFALSFATVSAQAPPQPQRAKFVAGLATTVKNFKDTATGVTYASLYAGATLVNSAIIPEGYRIVYRVAFYASQADFAANKKAVMQKQFLVTVAKYPTEAQILAAFLSLFHP